jgi:hypothetical protein
MAVVLARTGPPTEPGGIVSGGRCTITVAIARGEAGRGIPCQ